jgi:2-polyprenyl-3-methyl-5-hydroxy-6-metoxy-1,4-benzoquinol methylase
MSFEGCLICRETAASELHSQGVFSYLRCVRCGLVYLHPQPDFSCLRDLYAGKAGCRVDTGIDPTGEEIIHKSRFEGELDRIEQLILPGRILDIGSAWGFFLAEARERGWKTWGVELSLEASEYARNRFCLDVFTGKLAEARLPKNHFHAVTLWHVLEHIPDPLAELTEIRKIIRNDGLLVISVPTPWSASEYSSDPIPLHLFYFDKATLATLARKAGFRVLRIEGQSSTGVMAKLKRAGIRDPRQFVVRHWHVLSKLRKLLHRMIKHFGHPREITLYAVPTDPRP